MRQVKEFSYQGTQALKIVEGLASNFLCRFAVMSFGREIENVGQALQGIVDLVRELVRHGGFGDEACSLHQQLLLTKLPDSDGSEVGEDLHDAEVALVKCLLPTVRQDVDGAPCFVRLPGEHKAIGYEGRRDSEEVEVSLGGADMLGASAFQTYAAAAGIVREDGVEHARILAGNGDPMVVRIFRPILFFKADSRAVGAAELNGGLHQHLQDGLRILDQSVGNAAHSLRDNSDIARAFGSRSK